MKVKYPVGLKKVSKEAYKWEKRAVEQAKWEFRDIQWLKDTFIGGTMVTLPVTLTIYLVYGTAIFYHETVMGFSIFQLFQKIGIPESLVSFVVGVLLFLANVVIGTVVRHHYGKALHIAFKTGVKKIPIIGKIFTTADDVFENMLPSGDGKKAAFTQVVALPYQGQWSIGFKMSEDTESGYCVVLVSIPPFPQTGLLPVVHRDELLVLDTINLELMIKMFSSFGAASLQVLVAFSAKLVERLQNGKMPKALIAHAVDNLVLAGISEEELITLFRSKKLLQHSTPRNHGKTRPVCGSTDIK